MLYSKAPIVPKDAEVRVIAMRAEVKRKSRKEMAEGLGIRTWQLDKIVGSLIAKDKTEKRQGMNKQKGGASGDLENPRTKRIIAMRKDHQTLKAIAQAIGKTTQRAQQIVARIIEIHGDQVFAPDKPVWCAYNAAKKLRTEGFTVSDATVISICTGGGIDCLERPRKDAKFLITELGMSQLRRHPRVTRAKKCAICRKKFKGQGMTCSAACHKKREHRKYKERGKNPLDSGRMHATHRKAMEVLPIVGGRTEWVVWSEALEVAKVSGTQLDYLRRTRIIAIKRDPTRKWRGKPRVLYSREEMKLIQPVFAAWRRAQARKRKKKGR